MPDVELESISVGGIPPEALERTFTVAGQPAKATTSGVIISPKNSKERWLNYSVLAEKGFDEGTFTRAYCRIDNRVNPHMQLEAGGKDKPRNAVQRWLKRGDFGQLTSKFLEQPSPDERHLWLREIVLPAFFELYPKGKLACVTYAPSANGHLAFLNTLKRASILNTHDESILLRHVGKTPMTAFRLNVPAEMIWTMLSFSTVLSFPEANVFVASCGHRYFLIFITDEPASLSEDENARHAPIERIIPNLKAAFDANTYDAQLPTNDDWVRRSLGYPFARCSYSAEITSEFLAAYIQRLDGLLKWLCDATHFTTKTNTFDLDFALQCYITVYVMLSTSLRLIVEQVDMFARKSAFFDVLELYAGLVDTKKQTQAWKAHLEQPFINKLLANLSAYPSPYCNDLVSATTSLLATNKLVIENGLIYDRNHDGTINIPGVTGGVTLEEFEVLLLRALRNTKHGLAIKEQQYLAVHTGSVGNDLPDYVIALWLNFVADQSWYTLLH